MDDTDKGRWVLTLFERLNYADLPYFIGLMQHLAERGFPGAMPVADKSGATLTTLNGKPTALVSRLQGQSVLFPTLEQCAAVGEVLAQMHALTASPSRPNSRGLAAALLGARPGSS